MFEITWKPDGLMCIFSGVLSGSELNRAFLAIEECAWLDSLRYLILDCDGIYKLNTSDSELEFIATRANVALQRNRLIKIALVRRNSLTSGFVESFNACSYSKAKAINFNTASAARKYIDT